MTEENNSTVSIRMTFPMKQWVEWDKDCKENYGDVRWLKVWNDHLNANKDKIFDVVYQRVDEVLSLYHALWTEVEEIKKGRTKEVQIKRTLGGKEYD